MCSKKVQKISGQNYFLWRLQDNHQELTLCKVTIDISNYFLVKKIQSSRGTKPNEATGIPAPVWKELFKWEIGFS